MDDRVREIGLWNFVNGVATRGVRPWQVTREDSTYFTWDPNQEYGLRHLIPCRHWRWASGVRSA